MFEVVRLTIGGDFVLPAVEPQSKCRDRETVVNGLTLRKRSWSVAFAIEITNKI